MTGDQWQGMAAFVVAIGSLAGSLGTLAMQFRQNKVTRTQGEKIDQVHAATTALVEATGTHKAIDESQVR